MGRRMRRPVIEQANPVTASDPLPCAKLGLESEDEAQREAKKHRMSFYKCRLCPRWHLTRDTKRYKKGRGPDNGD